MRRISFLVLLSIVAFHLPKSEASRCPTVRGCFCPTVRYLRCPGKGYISIKTLIRALPRHHVGKIDLRERHFSYEIISDIDIHFPNIKKVDIRDCVCTRELALEITKPWGFDIRHNCFLSDFDVTTAPGLETTELFYEQSSAVTSLEPGFNITSGPSNGTHHANFTTLPAIATSTLHASGEQTGDVSTAGKVDVSTSSTSTTVSLMSTTCLVLASTLKSTVKNTVQTVMSSLITSTTTPPKPVTAAATTSQARQRLTATSRPKMSPSDSNFRPSPTPIDSAHSQTPSGASKAVGQTFLITMVTLALLTGVMLIGWSLNCVYDLLKKKAVVRGAQRLGSPIYIGDGQRAVNDEDNDSMISHGSVRRLLNDDNPRCADAAHGPEDHTSLCRSPLSPRRLFPEDGFEMSDPRFDISGDNSFTGSAASHADVKTVDGNLPEAETVLMDRDIATASPADVKVSQETFNNNIYGRDDTFVMKIDASPVRPKRNRPDGSAPALTRSAKKKMERMTTVAQVHMPPPPINPTGGRPQATTPKKRGRKVSK